MNYFCCLLAIAYLGAIAMAQDYCDMLNACEGKDHIGCRNNNQINSKCAATATFYDLLFMQADILKSFNDKRNALAGGKIPNLSPANRMATMLWDNELAKLAGMNVKTCELLHDKCHATAKFKAPGQNLGRIGWYAKQDKTTKELVLEVIDKWWAQNKDANMTDINSNPVINIGHFTAMARDKNPRVGCGALRFKENNNMETIFVTCNMATTNYYQSQVYASGPAASKCTTGRNPLHRNLCSIMEVYTGL